MLNKTVRYNIYTNENGRLDKIEDTTEVKLPEVEMLSDTLKGSGILGEVDFPTFLQTGSMTLEISIRATNEKYGKLLGARSIEIRWVTDKIDTSNIKVGVDAHKAFIQCINKKFDEGKISEGEAQEGSLEYEVLAYKRTINGKEILNIDKFNNIFAINGKNLTQDIDKYL